MEALIQALWRNQGQVLTPELIHGLVVSSQSVPPLDKTIAYSGQILPSEVQGITYQVERLADILDEVRHHHQMQWDEVEGVREELNPNYAFMMQAEKDGRYVMFTARRDGKLIGNTSCYIYDSLHTSKRAAKEDTMYVIPEERKGMMAVRFFKYCEDALVALGVQEIQVQVKTTNKAHKLWERQGYVFSDRVLTKLIKPDD